MDFSEISMNSNVQMNPNVQKYLAQVQQFRLLDDDFMKVVFAHDNRAAQKVLQIIMEKPDLIVREVKTEDDRHNLRGHSVRLDVHAIDSTGKHYDIEIQRSNKGAGCKRARYNLSLLDSANLDRGQDYDALPETYIIFIPENDVFGHGLPMYHIERQIEETGELFRDAGHIIYVNSEYRGDDEIGKLMSDFRVNTPEEMNFRELSEIVGYYKGTERGVEHMSKAGEELYNRGVEEGIEQGIEKGIEQGVERERVNTVKKLYETMSREQIAVALDLPLKRVDEILDQ